MAIERDGWNGPVTFCCDSCGEVQDTHCSDFSGALAKIKSRGWRVVKTFAGWDHYCRECKDEQS